MIRGATIMGLLVGTLLAVFVFAIKYDVQDLESEYNTLNRSIEREHQAIHVLKAEWSYLNEPERLRDLAEMYLGHSDVTYLQMGKINFIPMRSTPELEIAQFESQPESVGDPPGTMASIEATLRELRKEVDTQ